MSKLSFFTESEGAYLSNVRLNNVNYNLNKLAGADFMSENPFKDYTNFVSTSTIEEGTKTIYTVRNIVLEKVCKQVNEDVVTVADNIKNTIASQTGLKVDNDQIGVLFNKLELDTILEKCKTNDVVAESTVKYLKGVTESIKKIKEAGYRVIIM